MPTRARGSENYAAPLWNAAQGSTCGSFLYANPADSYSLPVAITTTCADS